VSGFPAPRPRANTVRRLLEIEACRFAVGGPGVRRGDGGLVIAAREALATAAENRAIERAEVILGRKSDA
jgi:hypothetical protein